MENKPKRKISKKTAEKRVDNFLAWVDANEKHNQLMLTKKDKRLKKIEYYNDTYVSKSRDELINIVCANRLTVADLKDKSLNRVSKAYQKFFMQKVSNIQSKMGLGITKLPKFESNMSQNLYLNTLKVSDPDLYKAVNQEINDIYQEALAQGFTRYEASRRVGELVFGS